MSALCLVWTAKKSEASTKLILLGGLNDTLSPSENTGTSFTGGVDLSFGLGMVANLTIGGEYLSRNYTVSTSVTVAGETVSASGTAGVTLLHVPVILSFNLSHFLSLGVGGFYDVAISSGAPSNEGLTGDLKLHLGATPFFIEGRYNYGLDSQAADWGGNTSEVQGFLGLAF
jgi:hypothetical protein